MDIFSPLASVRTAVAFGINRQVRHHLGAVERLRCLDRQSPRRRSRREQPWIFRCRLGSSGTEDPRHWIPREFPSLESHADRGERKILSNDVAKHGPIRSGNSFDPRFEMNPASSLSAFRISRAGKHGRLAWFREVTLVQ